MNIELLRNPTKHKNIIIHIIKKKSENHQTYCLLFPILRKKFQIKKKRKNFYIIHQKE